MVIAAILILNFDKKWMHVLSGIRRFQISAGCSLKLTTQSALACNGYSHYSRAKTRLICTHKNIYWYIRFRVFWLFVHTHIWTIAECSSRARSTFNNGGPRRPLNSTRDSPSRWSNPECVHFIKIQVQTRRRRTKWRHSIRPTPTQYLTFQPQ